MKETLQQIQTLARQAYKSTHRGWDDQAAEQIEQIYRLSLSLMPLTLTRCAQCGAKPDLDKAKRLDEQFRARTQETPQP